MGGEYNYTISTDFTSGVNPSKLTAEINASSISSQALEYINTDIVADDCDLKFEANLTAGEVTTLDSIIAAHDGSYDAITRYSTSAGVSSTTSTSWQDKISVTTPLLSGTYLIEWSAIMSGGADKKQSLSRVYDDTNSVVLDGPHYTYIGLGSSDRILVSGFFELSFSGEARTLKLQYSSSDGTTLCEIRDAKLRITPV